MLQYRLYPCGRRIVAKACSSPRLQEFVYSGCRSERRSPRAVSWVSPSLRSLRCSPIFLFLRRGFLRWRHSLLRGVCRSIAYDFAEDDDPVRVLLSLLASMPSVSDVELKLLNADEITAGGSFNLPLSDSPSVTSFLLQIPMFNMLGGREKFIDVVP